MTAPDGVQLRFDLAGVEDVDPDGEGLGLWARLVTEEDGLREDLLEELLPVIRRLVRDVGPYDTRMFLLRVSSALSAAAERLPSAGHHPPVAHDPAP